MEQRRSGKIAVKHIAEAVAEAHLKEGTAGAPPVANS